MWHMSHTAFSARNSGGGCVTIPSTTRPRQSDGAVRTGAQSRRRAGCPVDVVDRRERRTQAGRGPGLAAHGLLGVKPYARPGIFACPNPTGLPSQAADEGFAHDRAHAYTESAG